VANALMDRYVSECSTGFDELTVAVQQATTASREAAKAVRVALRVVAQQVGLMADVIVDGDLLGASFQQAFKMLAAEPPPTRFRLMQKSVGTRGARTLLRSW